MFQVMTTLFPSFLVSLVTLAVLTNVFWWLLSKTTRQIQYSAGAASILGIAISCVFTSDVMVKVYQNQLIAKAQEASRSPASTGPVDPLAAKAEFLKTVDALLGNPAQLNPQIKNQLFTQFQGLFPQGANDLVVYRNEIKKSYECHMHLFEDAVATLEKGKKVKSSETLMCESYPGQFFNREKLLSAEMMKSHDDLLAALLKKDKDQKLPSKDDLKNQVTAFKQRLDTVDKLFQ